MFPRLFDRIPGNEETFLNFILIKLISKSNYLKYNASIGEAEKRRITQEIWIIVQWLVLKTRMNQQADLELAVSPGFSEELHRFISVMNSSSLENSEISLTELYVVEICRALDIKKILSYDATTLPLEEVNQILEKLEAIYQYVLSINA